MKHSEQLAGLSAQLTAHTDEDNRRFNEMNGKLDIIATDVKSLLSSRSYGRGFWGAVLVLAGGAGGLASLLVTAYALWK